MNKVPIYNRLQFRLLLPVVFVGIVCATILVNYLSAPLKAYLTRQFDTNLRLSSMMGRQFCEEGLNYLLELQLERKPAMNSFVQHETLDKIRAMNRQFNGIHFVVTNSNGAFIASSMDQLERKWKPLSIHQLDDEIRIFSIDGRTVRAHVQFFPYWDWLIISYVFENDYKAPVRMAYSIIYMSTICVFLGVLATLMLVFHLFVNRPLNRLIAATEGVVEGRFFKVERIADNELGQLTFAFNDMVDSLESKNAETAGLIQQLQESEALFRSQFEYGSIGIALTGSNNKLMRVNRQLCQILGYSEEELLQTPWHEKDHPDDQEVERVEYQRMLNGEIDNYRMDKRIYHKNGNAIHVHVRVSCLRNPDGSVRLTIGSVLDITARKKVEEELKRNANFVHTLLNAVPTPVFYKDKDGLYQGCNKSFSEFIGVSQEDIRGKSIVDIWQKDEYKVFQKKDLELMANPRHQIYEIEMLDKDNNLRPVVIAKDVFRDEMGEAAGIVGAFLDVTELKAAEKAQAEAHRMLRLILDSIPVRVFWKDLNHVYMGANQPFAEDVGKSSPEELIGKTDFDLTFSREAELYRRNDREVMQSGRPKLYIEEPQRPDGSTGWVMINIVPMLDDRQNVIGVLGTYQDITEQKKADEEIRSLRNYLSNIINSMPSVLIGVDNDGQITQWNDKAFTMTGVSQESALGQQLEKVFPPLMEEKALVSEAINDKRVVSDPRHARVEDSQTVYEDITVFPLVANGIEGAVIRIDDITEQVRMEEMMVQSEKMLSVGGLAAGMAHEINNPLAGMIQTANIMRSRLEDLDLSASLRAAEQIGVSLEHIRTFMQERGIFRMLDAINESGERARDIVNNMLSFARKSDTMVSSHHPEQLLDRILDLAATDYDLKKQYDFKTIEIIRDYADDLPLVPCEGSKIQQVFLNILRNGAEAMQAEGTVEGARPRFIIRMYANSEKNLLIVEIEDNGPGMDLSTQARIFEPFFTTKPVGQGTGLGLSVSYFIVTQNHGGSMEVKSAPGQGSTFIIGLPLERADERNQT